MFHKLYMSIACSLSLPSYPLQCWIGIPIEVLFLKVIARHSLFHSTKRAFGVKKRIKTDYY